MTEKLVGEIKESPGWREIAFRKENVLEDNVAELAEVLDVTEPRARTLLGSVLDHYHFQTLGRSRRQSQSAECHKNERPGRLTEWNGAH